MQGEVAARSTSQGQPPPSPDPVYTLRPHSGEVTSLKFITDDSTSFLLSGTTSGQFSLWDLATKRQCWIETCGSPVLSISHILDKRLVLSQLKNATVLIWDLGERRQQGSLSIENPAFCQLSPFFGINEGASIINSNCFAVADSKYGKVNIYDTLTQKLAVSTSVEDPKSKGMCMSVQAYVTSTTAHVLGGFEDGSVVLWDCRNTARELSSLKIFTEPVMCLDMDTLRQSGVCGSPLKTLEVFCITQGQLQKQYSVELRNPGVASVKVRNDNRIIASGGWDGRIRVFGFKKGKPLALLNYHSGTVNAVAFVPTGAPAHDLNLLACGSKDERISLWRLY